MRPDEVVLIFLIYEIRGLIMKSRKALVFGVISASVAAGLLAPVYGAQAATLKTDKCSLHVSIAHPHAGQVETLTVTSTAGKTAVQVKIHYKTVSHTWKYTTGVTPKTTGKFDVGDPTKGYTVKLDGTVTGAPRGYNTGATCSTSFVPE
jgi:hypothetical protein